MTALRLRFTFLALAALTPLCPRAFAQSTPTSMVKPAASTPADTELKTRLETGWGIGASAGTTSGIGLSARRYFANGAGLHLGGMYLFSGETHWGNLGVQGLYTLARGRKTRLYALLGAQLLLEHDRHAAKLGPQQSPYPTELTLFAGPGVGLEIHFTRHFGWAIEVPVSVVTALEGNKDRLPFGGPVNLIPAANTSLTFYFR